MARHLLITSIIRRKKLVFPEKVRNVFLSNTFWAIKSVYEIVSSIAVIETAFL